MNGKADGPMSFAGEMVYSVRWPDGTVAQRPASIPTPRATSEP